MSLQLKDITAVGKAFGSANLGKVVDDDTIKVRAEQCLTCPLRRKVKFRFTDLASKLLGIAANRHRVPASLKDYKCGGCGCALLMLIPARGEDLHYKAEFEAKKKKHKVACWVEADIRKAQT